MVIVPDNLKAAVTRSARNKPVINEEFTAFAEHYGCTVYPARVRHPKDKALVENAVKLLYRSVYADIEGLVFNLLESLNAAIFESLSAFNGRRMSGRPLSRREQFEQIESDCLDAMEVTKRIWNRFKNKSVRRITSCYCICARWRNSRSILPRHSVHAKESWHWGRPSDWNGWWRQAHALRNCANTAIRK